MRGNNAARPFLWDTVYSDIPPSPVTAVAVPDNRFTLEGHELVIVEAGHTDSDDSTVLHVPDLGLVVAGDVIYNGAHQYIGDGLDFSSWRAAIDLVESLGARHIVSGHQPKQVEDDDAELANYPDHVGRYVLWAGARTQYGVRDNPGADITQLRLSGWL
jgi:glyoxylase-like metal-dependent hydrolase (beta-lactamase superfamily II)